MGYRRVASSSRDQSHRLLPMLRRRGSLYSSAYLSVCGKPRHTTKAASPNSAASRFQFRTRYSAAAHEPSARTPRQKNTVVPRSGLRHFSMSATFTSVRFTVLAVPPRTIVMLFAPLHLHLVLASQDRRRAGPGHTGPVPNYARCLRRRSGYGPDRRHRRPRARLIVHRTL